MIQGFKRAIKAVYLTHHTIEQLQHLAFFLRLATATQPGDQLSQGQTRNGLADNHDLLRRYRRDDLLYQTDIGILCVSYRRDSCNSDLAYLFEHLIARRLFDLLPVRRHVVLADVRVRSESLFKGAREGAGHVFRPFRQLGNQSCCDRCHPVNTI